MNILSPEIKMKITLTDGECENEWTKNLGAISEKNSGTMSKDRFSV
jgi:hypothetical protein